MSSSDLALNAFRREGGREEERRREGGKEKRY